MVDHYKYISGVLKDTMYGQKLDFAEKILNNAIKITEAELDSPSDISRMEIGNHLELRKSFLSAILAGDKRRALFIIKVAVESKVPLNEIYIDVFQEAMLEVGTLWQKNIITVDKEHVCTAITQMVMSDLANEISSTPRIGKSILACCVGDELHDMGIRILCDIFELAGWDSHYIGASVPSENIINSIIENKPDLLALSVTMPHHLKICSTVIKDIRNNPNTKDVKIAVGGRAVSLTQNIESVWDVEVATKSAPELLNWATREFNIGETEVL